MKSLFTTLVVFVSAWSQDTNGLLSGQITDPSGGVVAGATVQAVNSETGHRQTQTTTSAGMYRLSLPAGEYSLQVSAPNFAKYVQNGIGLSVSQAARLDVQ